MVKLIREFVESDVELLTEFAAGSKKKHTYITGVFMQSEALNRNGRIYPRVTMEGQVNKYQGAIQGGTATGELGHPNTPTINLDRVSHLVTELKMDKNDVIGKAKILDTDCGKTAKGLMEGGVKLGVSSRGLGSLKEQGGQKIVQPDFALSAIDIVADPSAPKAWMESLTENAEWIQDLKGNWIQRFNEDAIKTIRSARKSDLEKVGITLFEKFIKGL